jgi:hypothetical protein
VSDQNVPGTLENESGLGAAVRGVRGPWQLEAGKQKVSRKGETYPLSHLYGRVGLVRLCPLGQDRGVLRFFADSSKRPDIYGREARRTRNI